MDLYILRLIAGNDMEIWRIFSVLSKSMNAEFNMLKYEHTFRQIVRKSNGSIWYYLNGLVHRSDGPAAIFKDGERWHKHGRLHKVDGPAVVFCNGDYKAWYVDNVLHRLDGYAIASTSGNFTHVDYYIYGRGISKREWIQKRHLYI